MRWTRRGLAGAGFSLVAWPRGRGQTQGQDRPLRLIVPFPPGGPVDTAARIMAQALTGPLGQPVLVENRSGAGGNIGVDAVAKAAPDGLTLAFASTGALAVNPSLLPNMPYETLRDLAPVAILSATPSVLVVRPAGSPGSSPGASLGASADLAALLAAAKRQPGKLSFASTGPGGTPHLAAELLKLRAGVDITHVAYRGAAPVLTAMLAGEIDMAFLDVPVLLPHIRDGRLRPLVVTAPTRAAVLPEVPTTAEAGLPDVLVENWYAMLAPAGTPAGRVAQVAAAVQGVLAPGTETRRRFEEMGSRILAAGPAEATDFIRAEIAKWAEVVRRADIRPD